MSEIDIMSREDLYVQVKGFVLEHIRTHDYQAEDRLPTNREFSKMLKVSPLTVQRAISGLIDEGVVYARRGKGTFLRDPGSAVPARPASGLYACVFPSVHSNTVAATVYALDNVIFDRGGNHMLLCNSQLDLDREVTLLDSLLDRAVDALVYQPNPLTRRHPVLARAIEVRLQKFLAAGVPVVMLDDFMKPDGYDTIVPGEMKTCDLAVRHLMGLGHRRLLFLAHKELFEAKIKAFEAVTAECGLSHREVRQFLIDEDDIEEGAWQAMTRALDEGYPFTAIVAATDRYATACYLFLKAEGIACPKDVSIVGADNLEFIDRVEIGLTTTWCEPAKVAELVQQQIEARLGRGDLRRLPAERIEVEPELLVRQSTAAPSLKPA